MERLHGTLNSVKVKRGPGSPKLSGPRIILQVGEECKVPYIPLDMHEPEPDPTRPTWEYWAKQQAMYLKKALGCTEEQWEWLETTTTDMNARGTTRRER